MPKNGQQPKPPGDPNAFHWHKIFALDSAVVETQNMFSSHGGFPTIAMHHHGETIKSNQDYDETKKRAHDSQIGRAKENPKLSRSGPSYR